MKNKYLATAHTKEWELVGYEEGASGELLCSDVSGVSFSSPTPEGLKSEIREFFGWACSNKEDCEVRWDADNPGEIRVRLMEDEEGCTATEWAVEAWKAGKVRLYHLTYFLRVEKRSEVQPEEVTP